MNQKGAVWIDRTLIVSPVSIGMCFSERSFNRELKRLNVPLTQYEDWILPGKDSTVHFFTATKDHRSCCVVCIRISPKTKNEVVSALLAHEAMHIWRKIKSILGEEFPSAEFEAYGIQAIVLKLIHHYNKRARRYVKK